MTHHKMVLGLFSECVLAIGTNLLLNSCTSSVSKKSNREAMVSDGPANAQQPEPQTLGDSARGREVFRFETFGNEAFWFNAMRMQQGMQEAKVTPKMMLELGLHIDME